MTMAHDKKDAYIILLLVADEEEDDSAPEEEDVPCDEFPKVESKTPITMVPKLPISIRFTLSKPYETAKVAEVIGSAALTVSTKLAEVPEKPRLVAKKPKVKQSPANTKYRVCVDSSTNLAVSRALEERTKEKERAVSK
jgi:hypothetical protein